MSALDSVKTPRLVGVITTADELRLAARMPRPPDFFELRLDHLCKIDMQIPRLPAPLIITARDPREGGANKLSIKRRRELLAQFLDRAACIDIELRNARAFKPIVDLVLQRTKLRVILSFHDFNSTPSARRLSAMAAKAESLGADVFKVATRTDTEGELARLRQFAVGSSRCDDHGRRSAPTLPLIVMGIGKLGLKSRMQLASRFVYGALKASRFAGQPTLAQLRSAFRRRSMR
jgi:3-dehydroquinate dehydratase type I